MLPKNTVVAVLQEFGLRLAGRKELSLGTANLNELVETDKGPFVLRQWLCSGDENILFECSILQHLHAKGFPVPKPIKTADGKEFALLDGKHFGLFEFLGGRKVGQCSLNREQLRALGRTLAEMQLALKDCNPRGKSFLKDSFDFSFDYGVLRNDFPKISPAFGEAKLELGQKVKMLEPELKKFGDCTNIGPIHNDFSCWNFKFAGNKISAILDFGDACIGSRAADLAVLLSDQALHPHKTDFKSIKEIFSAYSSIVTLSESEKRVLPLLMLHRAVRIALFFANSAAINPAKEEKYLSFFKKSVQKARQLEKTMPKISF